jgi:hypothetical protein
VQHSVTRIDREFHFLGRHLSIPFCSNSPSRNDRWSSPNDEDYRSNVLSSFEATASRPPQDDIWRAQKSGSFLPCLSLDQHAHDVAFFHDQVLDGVDLDLGARPFAEQDAVADLDVDWNEFTALVATAGANGDDLALLRLLLGGIGNDDTTGCLRLGIDTLDDKRGREAGEISLVFSCGFVKKSGRFRRLIVYARTCMALAFQ